MSFKGSDISIVCMISIELIIINNNYNVKKEYIKYIE